MEAPIAARPIIIAAAMYSRSMFKFSMRISIYLDVIDCIKMII